MECPLLEGWKGSSEDSPLSWLKILLTMAEGREESGRTWTILLKILNCIKYHHQVYNAYYVLGITLSPLHVWNLSPHHSLIRQVWLLSPSTDEETTTAAAAAESLQLCPTLRNPIDGSPPGSPIPGILQARTLEWVAISFSKIKLHNICKRYSNDLPEVQWGKKGSGIKWLPWMARRKGLLELFARHEINGQIQL